MARKLWGLFLHNFYLSAFTFGGGYVIVSLMQKEYVDKLHWIEEREMIDLVSLAQSAPGALAVNASVMVGWKIAGLAGMLVSVVATVLPCMIVITAVSLVYSWFLSNPVIRDMLVGMQAGIAALVASAALSMAKKLNRKEAYVLCGLAVVLSVVFHVSVLWIILGALALGVVHALAVVSRIS